MKNMSSRFVDGPFSQAQSRVNRLTYIFPLRINKRRTGFAWVATFKDNELELISKEIKTDGRAER